MSVPPAPLCELRDCSRSYDNGRILALDHVSVQIARGAFIAVTGPSGSGKSTLLDVMCGLEEPSHGEVWFDGRRIAGRAAWARIRAARIGFIFQNFYLMPSLSVAENVELALLGQTRSAQARKARVTELLQMLGLGDRHRQFPMELSGGERQRVAIARALANRPELIVADEPTGSLDTKNSAQIIELLARLHRDQGITVVIVTHDPAIAARCERVIVVVDGQIASDSTAQTAKGRARCV